jgi:tRNA pseudouridine55 synthase
MDNTCLLVDKPAAWTSFDVVNKLKRMFAFRKVGHAGTLDPMATGLLICLFGRATKQVEHFMDLPKEYEGVIRLGETTPSFDAETEVIERKSIDHLSDGDLERERVKLTGDLLQTPPMYSAIKVGGERLYRKARRGEVIERAPRSVTIYEFAFTGRNGSDISFRIQCSKGTYVRSLAHDFGQHLGVGAHLSLLRRTRIGSYSVRDAWSVPDLDRTVAIRVATR